MNILEQAFIPPQDLSQRSDDHYHMLALSDDGPTPVSCLCSLVSILVGGSSCGGKLDFIFVAGSSFVCE